MVQNESLQLISRDMSIHRMYGEALNESEVVLSKSTRELAGLNTENTTSYDGGIELVSSKLLSTTSRNSNIE
jgi:hypothetical protein